jgi:hypothetical protein
VKRSKVQERDTAARVGGKVTKASGAGAFEKADVRVKGLIRLELKTTQAASFRVTEEMIEKISSQALQAGEIPAMEIEINGGLQRVAVIPTWALDMLLDKAKD